MEKTIFKSVTAAFGLAAVLMYQGCMEDNSLSFEQTEEERIPVSVTVDLPDAALSQGSKVQDISTDGTVNSLQVFVFRNDNNKTLDAYGTGTGKTVSMDCTTGDRIFVALANAPSLASITKLSELQAAKSSLANNSVGALVMSSTAVSKTITTGVNTVSLTVARIAARVSISKITNALSAPAYASTAIQINKIYLSNVAADRLYLSSSTPTSWYNQKGISTDQTALLSSGTLTASVSAGSSYSTPHYFYCYPNPTTTDSSSSTWSARFTRLVVQVTISGQTYYYPISIENIEANHTYEIKELKITRLGATSADTPVTTGTISLTLTVKDWETGASYTVTI